MKVAPYPAIQKARIRPNQGPFLTRTAVNDPTTKIRKLNTSIAYWRESYLNTNIFIISFIFEIEIP